MNKNSIFGPLSMTVEEFCRAHGISRVMFYKLRKEGKGPKIFRVGTKPLISVEAAADWRREMEEEAASEDCGFTFGGRF